MAFSYGFFNAKNLDRTYTAENFNDYLGSIICDGIQDNFGQCFKLSVNKLKLTIGSGKAWIQGHYFISDTAYTYDLSRYVDESLPRYMAVGICCNTSENVRNVAFEILTGTPATNPSVPRFLNTDYKKYLTLCIIRLDAGTSELKITDYRENGNFCGYVRCILGKCKVTDMLAQLSEIQEQMKNYTTTVNQLTTKINELTLKIDEMTGDVVSIGECGQNVDFVLYSDGRLLLKGTGATFDYNSDSNPSPFLDNNNIKTVVVSEGITGIGERLFQYCNNLKTASLPTTLTVIKRSAFMPHIDEYLSHQVLNGLTELRISERVAELGVNAFAGTAIKSVTVPSSVTTVGAMVFSECQYLETVRYGGKVISDRMFVRCTKLKNLTLTRNVKEIVGGCFNYCESLNQITYEGSLADWNAVKKNTNWDSRAVDIESPLVKIQCLDGYMEYVAGTKTWKEVKA
ncbi:leucine-rich repeat domain-containing protein [Ruminococcus callidus]